MVSVLTMEGRVDAAVTVEEKRPGQLKLTLIDGLMSSTVDLT